MSFHSLNNSSQSDIWPDCLLYLLVTERATVSLKTRIIRVSSADSAREQQFRDQNLSSEEWTSRHAWQPPQTDFSVQQKPALGFSGWNQYWVKQNNAGRPTGRCSNRWGEIKHSPHSTNTADPPDLPDPPDSADSPDSPEGSRWGKWERSKWSGFFSLPSLQHKVHEK